MRYGMGVTLVLGAGVLWSFQALIIRQIAEAGSWTVLFWRSLAMAPVIFAFLAYRTRAPFAAIAKAGLAGVIGGFGLVGAMGGAIFAFQTTTVANAAFLFAAAPFLTAVLGRLILREPVAPQTWTAIGVALVGIFIMVRDGLAAGASAGNLAALASALGFAAFSVALRWRRIDDSFPATLLGSLFACATGAIVATRLGQPLAVPAADIAWCALMGVVTLSSGMILFTLGSRVVPSAEGVLLSNTEVMLAPFWVWLLLGETASPATFLGGAILLGAILYNAFSGVRRLAAA